MNMTSFDVYQRIYKVLGCKSDTELSRKLGLAPGNMSVYKSKEKFSLNLLEKLMETDLCTAPMLRYVLTGDSDTGDKETIQQIAKLVSQVEILQDTIVKSKK